MKRLQAARAAMVALSALGMIWSSSPALAANDDASVVTVHAKQNPNQPTTTPNVPGGGAIYQSGPADVDVTYISQAGGNGNFQWTYEVKNIGTGTAFNVRVMKNAIRNNYMGNIETDIEFQELGTIAPGVVKTVVIACAPKWQQPPCSSSTLNVSSMSGTDSNPGNNWDEAPNNYP